jgi:small subunit ribosomal protein S14
MAKKSLVTRNEKRKIMSSFFSKKRAALLKISLSKDISFEERLKAQIKLAKLPRNSSSTRIRMRCSITGRARGNLRKFGLSRIIVRDLASWGHIPGLTKSSW